MPPPHRLSFPRRALPAALAAGAIVALATPVASSAQPAAPPSIVWTDCGDGFECAVMQVPLDHRRPRRATIDLSLIRKPAADQEHRIGTLFIGHPVGTVDLLREELPPPALGLLAQFDVIAYDGRGTNIDCGTDESLLEGFRSTAIPPDPAEIDAMVASAEEYGRRCAETYGDLLPHMTTTAMARDLDLMRAAVGDEQVTFVGPSQGTAIGAHYASMFPGRVRAMVLDAAWDAETGRDRPLELWREQNSAFEHVLDRFFMACVAHQDECGFGGTDPESAFDALLERLDDEPIPAPDPSDPRPVDGDEVRLAMNDAMYDPSGWPALATALSQAESGDGSLIRQLASVALNNRVSPTINQFIANIAVDQDFPDDVATLAQEANHLDAMVPHFAAEATHINFVAGLWPARARDVFDGDFQHADDAPPILVIGGTNDPATPYVWAERLVADLGNARLFTFDSDGHGAINDLDPCVLGPVLTYLTDPAIPLPADLVCEQQLEPFES